MIKWLKNLFGDNAVDYTQPIPHLEESKDVLGVHESLKHPRFSDEIVTPGTITVAKIQAGAITYDKIQPNTISPC